jgi:leader peptidase (prepilin peptidase)/N-methyltransferase
MRMIISMTCSVVKVSSNLYMILIFRTVIAGLLGLVIGSFLLVVADRLNTGMSIVKGRSLCMSCGRTLTAIDLVPLLSFLWLRGRCRTCNATFSWVYPVVEVITSAAFVIIALQGYSIWFTVLLMAITGILIPLSLYDLRHYILPDKLTYALVSVSFLAIVFGVLFPAVGALVFQQAWYWHVIAGLALPLPFWLLWLFSKGRLIGLGDIKLMIPMGLLLGFWQGISAVVIAFWLGALLVLLMFAWKFFRKFYRKFRKKKTQSVFAKGVLSQQIPFGPFLALGLWIVLVFQVSMLDIVEWFL